MQQSVTFPVSVAIFCYVSVAASTTVPVHECIVYQVAHFDTGTLHTTACGCLVDMGIKTSTNVTCQDSIITFLVTSIVTSIVKAPVVILY